MLYSGTPLHMAPEQLRMERKQDGPGSPVNARDKRGTGDLGPDGARDGALTEAVVIRTGWPMRAPRPRLFCALLCALLLLQPGVSQARAERTARRVARDLAATLSYGGLARSYIVHVPPSPAETEPMPLLLLLHRAGGTAREMESITHMDDVADRYGFLVVYPDGYQNGWSDGRQPPLVDDVGFLTALVGQLRQDYAIDAHRIAVAGLSNGGFMAQTLACARSDLFSSSVAVAATMPVKQARSCHPRHPVSMLMIEGTADPYVPYAGGTIPGDTVPLLSSFASARTWARIDECDSEPLVIDQAPDIADGTSVTRSTYMLCAGAASVIRYTIWGGGHTWPGGGQYLPVAQVGQTSRNLDASVAIWLFVRAHPREE